ncbi:MAG: hypothetical protein HY654_12805 [Acidobacteria bacterium]|nr:hypothetical protein [Acidobacteriota bacterium]
MNAAEQTRSMLTWWAQVGVDRADLAVRRTTGVMLWHHDLVLHDLPLTWARAENAHHADVYIRPARGHAWPLLFVDDVTVEHARQAAHDVDALLVETSPAGGCHVWLRCDCLLDEGDRGRAQRWWVNALDGDPGSVSGEHLGRLAGFKNWKRGGCWVNVLAVSHELGPWHAADLTTMPRPTVRDEQQCRRAGLRDTTPSGRDWAWACTLLEHGQSPDQVYARLVDRARPRRGTDAERYARRTVERASRHVGVMKTANPHNQRNP